MKKIKKSTGVAIAFLIYVSVTAAYLLPRNTGSQSDREDSYSGRLLCYRSLALASASEEGTNA